MIKDIQKSDLFDDVLIFTNSAFQDDRGEFIECYREKDFGTTFLQDNISISKKNTLRGLHFQFDPPQGKLVTVIKGTAIDIILDINFCRTEVRVCINVIVFGRRIYKAYGPESLLRTFLSACHRNRNGHAKSIVIVNRS